MECSRDSTDVFQLQQQLAAALEKLQTTELLIEEKETEAQCAVCFSLFIKIFVFYT